MSKGVELARARRVPRLGISGFDEHGLGRLADDHPVEHAAAQREWRDPRIDSSATGARRG